MLSGNNYVERFPKTKKKLNHYALFLGLDTLLQRGPEPDF